MIIGMLLMLMSDKPLRLMIDSPILQNLDTPLVVLVTNARIGENITLEIVEDCSESMPPDYVSCVVCRIDVPASQDRIVLFPRDLRLKEGKTYWIRGKLNLRISGSGLFGVNQNPCDLWSSVFDTFLGGHCSVNVLSLLDEKRGDHIWRRFDFKIGIFEFSQNRSRALPKTSKVTGIYWVDDDNLLYSSAEGGGVSRYHLPTDTSKKIVKSGSCKAPFILRGRVGYLKMEETTGDWCLVYDKVVIDLPVALDQILRVNEDSNTLLGFSYGILNGKPSFFKIDLNQKQLIHLGLSNQLYFAAQKQPGNDRVLIQSFGVDEASSWIELRHELNTIAEISHISGGQAWLPTWSPSGKRFAYLVWKPE